MNVKNIFMDCFLFLTHKLTGNRKMVYIDQAFLLLLSFVVVSHDFLTFLKPMAGGVVQTQTFSKVSLYVLRIQNGKDWQKWEEMKVSLCA